MFPGTQVTIGPTIENGFYYDFFRNQPFTTEDFEAIEKEMRRIVERGASFTREVWSRDDAIKFFTAKGEGFKVELIQDLPQKRKPSRFISRVTGLICVAARICRRSRMSGRLSN